MTFYDVLEQVLALLQRHQRVSYRALQLQFPLLDPTAFAALRDELLFQGVACDEGGKGLVWTGGTSALVQPAAVAQPQPNPVLQPETSATASPPLSPFVTQPAALSPSTPAPADRRPAASPSAAPAVASGNGQPETHCSKDHFRE